MDDKLTQNEFQDVPTNGNAPIDPCEVYTDWDQLLEEYDGQYARHVNTIQSLMQRYTIMSSLRRGQTLTNHSLVSQLLNGCKQPKCQNPFCATGIRNSADRPVRDYTPRSARILALELLNQSNPDAHLCQHVKSEGSVPTPDTEAGPRDPSSLAQRIADTSCMTRLAAGEALPRKELDCPEQRRVAAITAKLQTQCKPPFDKSGCPNPRFVPNNEVADTVATALNLFYSLLPEENDQVLWQSLAHYTNNGHVLPGQTLDSNHCNPNLIGLLQIFASKPYARMCEQICKVIALRTQVEDVAAKFRPSWNDESGNGNVLDLLAHRVTSIARWHTVSRKDKWVPWPYPLWFKNIFLQHWDGKPAVARGTIACGALELLEMQQRIWDSSNPDKTSDANLLPYVYNRTDNTEMVRSWMTHNPPVTTASRHLFSFPCLYSDGQTLMHFRTLNHLRMRYANRPALLFLDNQTLTVTFQGSIHDIACERGSL